MNFLLLVHDTVFLYFIYVLHTQGKTLKKFFDIGSKIKNRMYRNLFLILVGSQKKNKKKVSFDSSNKIQPFRIKFSLLIKQKQNKIT